MRTVLGLLRARIAWCLVASLVVCAASAYAAELQSTKEFADIAAAVEHAVAKHGAEHVLLALDIDNTVMAMDHDLGSDHWFEWQRFLQDYDPKSPLRVAATFDDLIRVQGILYDRGSMHPPEDTQPATIERLQRLGIATILLTSRGPDFRAVTERELKRCGYDIAATALPVPNAPARPFLAYNPGSPEKDGLTSADIVTYKLESPKPVSYANGIFLTAGQHKGAMLLTLLEDSPRTIKAVIYADDNLRHVGSVFSAAVARDLDVSSFHYQHEDPRVQRFNYSDKRDVDREWKAVQRELEGAEEPKVAVVKKPVLRKFSVKCPPRRMRCCR
jgi:hypothetical protein